LHVYALFLPLFIWQLDKLPEEFLGLDGVMYIA